MYRKVDFFFPIPAVVRLEINHGNGYGGNFTVYIKVIIYIYYCATDTALRVQYPL